jgi:polyhydroxyalkanoate synthesis regulator phasin
MSDLLRKAVSLGLGATIAGKEKIQQIVDELVVKGELGQREAKDLVTNLAAKGEEQRDHLKQMVQDQVKRVLDELNIATKQDLKELEERLKTPGASTVPGNFTDPQASTMVPASTVPPASKEYTGPAAEPSLTAPSSPTVPTKLP